MEQLFCQQRFPRYKTLIFVLFMGKLFEFKIQNA